MSYNNELQLIHKLIIYNLASIISIIWVTEIKINIDLKLNKS